MTENHDREKLERAVAEFDEAQPWNHNFLLPHGIETKPGQQQSHGKNLVKYERLKPILEKLGLEGTKVLDVGCNEGFFAHRMAELGASVAGIDVDEKRIAKARFVADTLGAQRLCFSVVDIYSREFSELEPVDFCLCLGFIHRIPDPFRAVAALAGKCDTILFEWKALKFGPHDDAFAYFSPKGIDEEDYYGTEYWLLSYAALERILVRNGFRYFHRLDDPRQRRAILVAGKNPHSIFSEPDVRIHRGRIPALLSHGKRFVKTVAGVLSGRINA